MILLRLSSKAPPANLGIEKCVGVKFQSDRALPRFVEPEEFDCETHCGGWSDWGRGRSDDPPSGGTGVSGRVYQVPGLRAKRRKNGGIPGRIVSNRADHAERVSRSRHRPLEHSVKHLSP